MTPGDRGLIESAAKAAGVSSTVLAQVWRDGTRQALLSKTLRNPGLAEAPLELIRV
jgi:hypothetical protein